MKNKLIEKARMLSGPLKNPTGRLYGSYHLPGFKASGDRDTIKRFNYFGIPKNLSKFRVLDIGSNTGALSIEAARRGATVYGLEFNKERVELCNEIASKFNLKAKFSPCDFRKDWIAPNGIDVVFCCSVDNYIENKKTFFAKIIDINPNICYLEINTKELTNNQIFNYFKNEYNIEPIKTKLEKRRNFILHKKNTVYPVYSYQLSPDSWSEKFDTNGKKLKNGWQHIHQYKTMNENDVIFKKLKTKKQYEFTKHVYQQLKGSSIEENILSIEFIDDNDLVVRSPYIIGQPFSKTNYKITVEHKKQLLNVIYTLNSLGFAHNDINPYNIIINNNKLTIIDWDTLIPDITESEECSSDLNGMKKNHYWKNEKIELAIGIGIKNFASFNKLLNPKDEKIKML